MNKALEIKSTKVDYLKLIQLALNKQDWGKVYTINTYGDVLINVSIKTMNFKRNSAIFELTCVYNGVTDTWYNSIEVEYMLSNFKVEEFETLINKRIIRLVNECIEYTARKEGQSKYADLKYNYWDITEDKIQDSDYASEWNKIQKIDSDIREKFEDSIKEAVEAQLNVPYEENVKKYIETFKMRTSSLQEFAEIIKTGDEQ